MSTENTTLTSVMERYGLAVKVAIVSSAVTFGLLLMVFLAGPVYEWSGFTTFSLAVIPFALAFFYSLTALFHGMFSEKAVRDEEEKILLRKRKENKGSLLDISEDVRFTAGRTLLNFERYVPSVVTVISVIFLALFLIYTWKSALIVPKDAIKLSSGLPKQPMTLAFVCALSLALCMLLGIFLAGQSHVTEFRWLRPAGAWLMAGGVNFALSLISSLLLQASYNPMDKLFSRVLFGILILLGVELIFNFISEFYRPRTRMEERPVFESRLLSFFTEPGGVMRNLADSLDYQFGFKVSKTWIYSFFSRAILPALLLWLFLLWIFTGISEVRPGEVGVRSVLGVINTKAPVLEPGVYFKWPYPLENIRKVNVEEINAVHVGAHFEKDGKEIKPNVILWTSEHGKDSSKGYLVANDEVKGDKKAKFASDTSNAELAKAVSILEVTLPIYYRVKKDMIYDYILNFEDVRKLIIDISTQQATNYFASTDFMKDLSSSRTKIMDDLKKRIQSELDKLSAGVEITMVNMNDAHPPVKEVVPAFQDVLAAKEQAKCLIYQAEAAAASTVASGEIQSMKIVSKAQSDSFGVRTEAQADAFRFQRQLKGYRQQNALFMLRTYLDFMEQDCKELRKLVISATIPSQIYEFNLEESARLDLLNSGEISKFGK